MITVTYTVGAEAPRTVTLAKGARVDISQCFVILTFPKGSGDTISDMTDAADIYDVKITNDRTFTTYRASSMTHNGTQTYSDGESCVEWTARDLKIIYSTSAA